MVDTGCLFGLFVSSTSLRSDILNILRSKDLLLRWDTPLIFSGSNKFEISENYN